jgi:putative pyruvate formate lyase activating enzyme
MNNKIKIAWSGKHFGEEPPLVGNNNQGAGAIFFSGCNLRCVFCQNYQISQEKTGQDYTIEQLAEIMIDLQKQGAINIDLVSPTLWWQQIKEAIILAKKSGLKIPIIWNSNAYEAVNILKEMKGLIDIYLPDFKYGDDKLAFKYSGVRHYVKIAKAAINEMLGQVGYLKIDKDGLARKGMIIRHLILPNNVDNSLKALEILHQFRPHGYYSLMSQYYPIYRAKEFSELSRKINNLEYDLIKKKLEDLGLTNGWVQELDSSEYYAPDFTKTNPFQK